MKLIRVLPLLPLIVFFIAPVSLPLPAIAQNTSATVSYVYLGKEFSDIDEIILRIKSLDEANYSPLNELLSHIENGFFLAPYDSVIDALHYAKTILQSNYATLNPDQSAQLFTDFEFLMRKILNGELTVDTQLLETTKFIRVGNDDLITRTPHVRTLIINEKLNVLGKSLFYGHILTKKGIHVMGKLKVDKTAKFRKNVTISGTLSGTDASMESLSVTDLTVINCMDNLCVDNLSVVTATIDNITFTTSPSFTDLIVDCDLTVGCNISINDSTSAAVGNIIKNGAPFIHDFGASNTFVGINAGNFTATGFNNTVMGINALSSNTSGYNNTVMGSNAMQNNITGYQNIAIGQAALLNNSIGTDNTAVGNAALASNTIGINNTALGSGALNNNNIGSYNTAVGHAALEFNTTGFQNVAVGQQALLFNTTGFYNTAVGQGAMLFNTTGNANSAVGTGALVNNTIGVQNSALGYSALSSNITGGSSTAIGYLALNLNIVDGNTAVGALTLSANTTGFNNTAVGLAALENNSIAPNNVAIGAFALQSNTLGNQNTGVGASALTNNTIGSSNTAVGNATLASNTTGFNNTAVGNGSLASNTIGIQNSAIGVFALQNNTMGTNNTAVGQSALTMCLSGNNNIAVGTNAASALTSSESNDIYIGNSGVMGESNAIRIGTLSTQTTCFIQGINGVTTGLSAIPVLVDGNGQLGTISSSSRFKHTIVDMDEASANIYKLRPVTFAYNQDASETRQYGLIAEEVEKVFPEIVVNDENGEPFTVQYHVLPVLLLNEIQKQHNELLNHTTLITQLEQLVQTFAERLNALEAN
jgi:Chaperone of endosialidase